MRTWILALACLVLVPATSDIAQASVDGQRFQITVTSSVSGVFSGVLQFNANGSFTLTVPDDDDFFGTYSQVDSTSLTSVEGILEDSDEYFGTFGATADDPKQLPGLRGLLNRLRNTPATIEGSGFGNAGDVFKFTGTEILP
jgi:hypothetical protein